MDARNFTSFSVYQFEHIEGMGHGDEIPSIDGKVLVIQPSHRYLHTSGEMTQTDVAVHDVYYHLPEPMRARNPAYVEYVLYIKSDEEKSEVTFDLFDANDRGHLGGTKLEASAIAPVESGLPSAQQIAQAIMHSSGFVE
jgi:hypothetical protein